MLTFLAIQNTYTHLQMALFEENTLLDFVEIDKTKASKECIIALQNLLQKHHKNLNDLAFIAVNQGPGPFTTLRVVISTVNGLSFAGKIPLMGVNGLQALLEEEPVRAFTNVVALLNAFSHDLYYGIKTENITTYGCETISQVLDTVAQKIPQDQILFVGNGINQCKEAIQNTFGNRAHFLTPNPETASLEQIGIIALDMWRKQENICCQIQPIYYKPAFKQ